jgi:hypothetical protein
MAVCLFRLCIVLSVVLICGLTGGHQYLGGKLEKKAAYSYHRLVSTDQTTRCHGVSIEKKIVPTKV